jgi:hypothetical protein
MMRNDVTDDLTRFYEKALIYCKTFVLMHAEVIILRKQLCHGNIIKCTSVKNIYFETRCRRI